MARPLLDSCSCIRFRCCGAAEPPNLLPSLDSLSATLEIQQIEGLWLAALAGAVLLWRGPGSGSCFLRSIAVLVYNSEGHVRPPGLWLATLAGRCCFAVARPWSGSSCFILPYKLQKATVEMLQPSGRCCFAVAKPCLGSTAFVLYASEGHVRDPGPWLAELAETFRLVLSC